MTDHDEAADLLDAAAAARTVAASLKAIREDQRRARWMGYVIAGLGVMLVVLVVILLAILGPVVRTAHTVEQVAGPDALQRQAQQTQGFFKFFLCTQRENTSEARVLSGQDPLPLRDGCPPYNFDPHRPIVTPSTPTTATTAKPHPHAARSTSPPPTTAALRPAPTSPPTTVRSTTTTTCTTFIQGRCVLR